MAKVDKRSTMSNYVLLLSDYYADCFAAIALVLDPGTITQRMAIRVSRKRFLPTTCVRSSGARALLMFGGFKLR